MLSKQQQKAVRHTDGPAMVLAGPGSGKTTVITRRVKYLIENGLAVNGLEETQEDRARAVKGDISLQLRNPEIDNTHLNEYGYTALAHGVYETGKALGYW